ncbi:hypothetical protein D3C87_1101350 [compost metagenome]
MRFVEFLSFQAKNHGKFAFAGFHALLHKFFFKNAGLDQASLSTNFCCYVAAVGFHC